MRFLSWETFANFRLWLLFPFHLQSSVPKLLVAKKEVCFLLLFFFYFKCILLLFRPQQTLSSGKHCRQLLKINVQLTNITPDLIVVVESSTHRKINSETQWRNQLHKNQQKGWYPIPGTLNIREGCFQGLIWESWGKVLTKTGVGYNKRKHFSIELFWIETTCSAGFWKNFWCWRPQGFKPSRITNACQWAAMTFPLLGSWHTRRVSFHQHNCLRCDAGDCVGESWHKNWPVVNPCIMTQPPALQRNHLRWWRDALDVNRPLMLGIKTRERHWIEENTKTWDPWTGNCVKSRNQGKSKRFKFKIVLWLHRDMTWCASNK